MGWFSSDRAIREYAEETWGRTGLAVATENAPKARPVADQSTSRTEPTRTFTATGWMGSFHLTMVGQ
jgi:hypothetical protein